MANDPEQQKLDDLDARIQEAGKKSGGKAGDGEASELARSGNAAYEFIGAVLVCMVIGWLVDKYLHTKPWGILGFLIAGFIVGIANVWRSLNGNDQSVGLRKKDGA